MFYTYKITKAVFPHSKCNILYVVFPPTTKAWLCYFKVMHAYNYKSTFTVFQEKKSQSQRVSCGQVTYFKRLHNLLMHPHICKHAMHNVKLKKCYHIIFNLLLCLSRLKIFFPVKILGFCCLLVFAYGFFVLFFLISFFFL